MNKQPTVCVIGAGCSGLTTIKNLIQTGVNEITCYEQNSDVGGNWIYTAGESHSSVCETTHIISSKSLSQYVDFPMPENYPDYPSHKQVLAYFRAYCTRFGLRKYIQFNIGVKQISQTSDDRWKVLLTDGTENEFDFVLISNGHHSVPAHPEFREQFSGQYMHSHNFKNNQGFEGKKVLVVGAGNSACDCAVEISRVAEKVDMSIRTPQYIVPKFFLGKPTDVLNQQMHWLPGAVRELLLKISLKLQVGKYEDYFLKTPKHKITEAHPTLNSELLYKIRHGKVFPKPGIKDVRQRQIKFVDGTEADYDVMIAATGYQISTPFIDPSILDYSNTARVELYLRMFHPRFKSLIFIGLLQPQGAIWPLSDLQAKLAANFIMNRWKRPANIQQLAFDEANEISANYLVRNRHALEVNYHDFFKKITNQIPKNSPS